MNIHELEFKNSLQTSTIRFIFNKIYSFHEYSLFIIHCHDLRTVEMIRGSATALSKVDWLVAGG